MEFFNYKPEVIDGLKTSRTRFRDIVFSNPRNGIPGVTLYADRITDYVDGRSCSDPLPVISQTMADAAILAQPFTLYHPETGAEIGTMTFGELAGIVYSAAIAVDRLEEARLAAQATP